jgi:tetratricopeptide (TPR) repeat protein
MDRVAMLKEILADNPNDLFAHYGLAMEYANAGDTAAALAEYEKIVAMDPNYVPAYQMGGQLLLNLRRDEEARQWFDKGIEAARRTGNQHAESEMQGILETLPE